MFRMFKRAMTKALKLARPRKNLATALAQREMFKRRARNVPNHQHSKTMRPESCTCAAAASSRNLWKAGTQASMSPARIAGGKNYWPDAQEEVRETLVTTVLDAEPTQVLRIQGPTQVPMITGSGWARCLSFRRLRCGCPCGHRQSCSFAPCCIGRGPARRLFRKRRPGTQAWANAFRYIAPGQPYPDGGHFGCGFFNILAQVLGCYLTTLHKSREGFVL